MPQTDKALENGRRDGTITDDDALLLPRYPNGRSSQRHLAIGTRNKILFSLLDWRRFIGPFRENTIEDLYAGIEALKNGETRGSTAESHAGIPRTPSPDT